MKHFDHMHVMSLLGVCLDAGPAPYIIMPYMAHGSLLSYLKRERNSLFLPQDAADELVSKEVRKPIRAILIHCTLPFYHFFILFPFYSVDFHSAEFYSNLPLYSINMCTQGVKIIIAENEASYEMHKTSFS